MPRNTISDLRNHLFETLERLKDQEEPMDIERARAVAEVAQTIINGAKVEVDMVRAIGGSRPASSFFGAIREESRELPVIPRKQIG